MAQSRRAARKFTESSPIHHAGLTRPSADSGPARFRTARLAVTALMLLLPLFAHADIIHVDGGAAGADNGTSWADAYTDLQDALAGAASGDEIWVAAGVYKPVVPADTGNVIVAEREATLQLINGVEIYGGFAGTETQRDQRDPEANVTVLSGDIDDNDTTDGDGVVTSAGDIAGSNSYHVVTGSSTDGTAVLDGFTITAGDASSGTFPNNFGGGMFIDSGSPTLTNLAFRGNYARFNNMSEGGGLYNFSGNPVLTNVTFSDNWAVIQGGGMLNNSGSPVLNHVTFSDNWAEKGGGMFNQNNSNPTLNHVTFRGNSALNGGGIYNQDSSPALNHVIFSGNSVAEWGGGMFNDNSSPVLTNIAFSGNSADQVGGGMSNLASSPDLTNVTFSGNSAPWGGGMFNQNNSNPALTNIVFSGNSAGGDGGGMYNKDSSPILTNLTFSGNSAAGDGGGIFNVNPSTPDIRNTMFWNNQDSTGTGTAAASITIANDGSTPIISTPTISYSLVQGCNPDGNWNTSLEVCGSDSGNNLADADPVFVNTPDPNAAPTMTGNLRLQAGSPAIDTGNDDYINDIDNATDLDGNPRKFGDAVNLGPFERPDVLLKDGFEARSP